MHAEFNISEWMARTFFCFLCRMMLIWWFFSWWTSLGLVSSQLKTFCFATNLLVIPPMFCTRVWVWINPTTTIAYPWVFCAQLPCERNNRFLYNTINLPMWRSGSPLQLYLMSCTIFNNMGIKMESSCILVKRHK